MNNSEIRFVKNVDIDCEKWDRCIGNSPFGIAYAYSWFLERICNHWDALIWGDYLYVMPLVNNLKYGFSYIYLPFFTQQLGIFSEFAPEPEVINRFLTSIPKTFKLIDMNLNLGNIPVSEFFQIKNHLTYHLNLNRDSSSIRDGYNLNTRRNIT